MGNQEMLSELPTDAEYEEATVLFQDDFRIRDLAKLLAQLRAANERAEYLQGEHDYWQRLYRASEEERAELLVRAEAKLAAVPDAEGAD